MSAFRTSQQPASSFTARGYVYGLSEPREHILTVSTTMSLSSLRSGLFDQVLLPAFRAFVPSMSEYPEGYGWPRFEFPGQIEGGVYRVDSSRTWKSARAYASVDALREYVHVQPGAPRIVTLPNSLGTVRFSTDLTFRSWLTAYEADEDQTPVAKTGLKIQLPAASDRSRVKRFLADVRTGTVRRWRQSAGQIPLIKLNDGAVGSNTLEAEITLIINAGPWSESMQTSALTELDRQIEFIRESRLFAS